MLLGFLGIAGGGLSEDGRDLHDAWLGPASSRGGVRYSADFAGLGHVGASGLADLALRPV